MQLCSVVFVPVPFVPGQSTQPLVPFAMELEKRPATKGVTAEMIESHKDRSHWRSVALVATCTMAMILNVSFLVA